MHLRKYCYAVSAILLALVWIFWTRPGSQKSKPAEVISTTTAKQRGRVTEADAIAAIRAQANDLVPRPAPKTSPDRQDQAERISLKYRKLVYADFARRGTFEASPPPRRSVMLDVPPDPVRAAELRKAFWAEMDERVGADLMKRVHASPRDMARLEETIHNFGQFPVTFQFDLEEIDVLSGDPPVVTRKQPIVRVVEVYGGGWGGGQMLPDQFKSIYGDVAQVVIKSTE